MCVEAAFVLLGVTCQIYERSQYKKKGGKREIKDSYPEYQLLWPQVVGVNLTFSTFCQDWANLEGSKLRSLAAHVVNLTYRTTNARPYIQSVVCKKNT